MFKVIVAILASLVVLGFLGSCAPSLYSAQYTVGGFQGHWYWLVLAGTVFAVHRGLSK